jgi:hypothetical protein
VNITIGIEIRGRLTRIVIKDFSPGFSEHQKQGAMEESWDEYVRWTTEEWISPPDSREGKSHQQGGIRRNSGPDGILGT